VGHSQLIFILILSGFFSPSDNGSKALIQNKRWQLISIQDSSKKSTDNFKGIYILSFSDSTYQGVNCQAFSGSYSLREKLIIASPVYAKDTLDCSQEELYVEKIFSRHFGKMRFEATAEHLKLLNEKVTFTYRLRR
jgi:hypothetical protein